MKPEEDLENQSEITKLLMAVSQVKQMSKLHEAPEEIFLQVDPEGDGPGELDTLDGATWYHERVNHNDVCIYGKIEENKCTYIKIDRGKDELIFELSTLSQSAEHYGCYITDEYKSSEAEYLAAKVKLLAAASAA